MKFVTNRVGVGFFKKQVTLIFGFEKERLETALRFAKAAHAGQKRLTGNPYFEGHVLPVALNTYNYLSSTGEEFGVVQDALIAALAHDTLEAQSKAKLNDLMESFGGGVAGTVSALTKKPLSSYIGSKDEQKAARDREYFNTLRRLGKEFPHLLVIKLIDNLHNISTLKGIKKKGWLRKQINESRRIYLPLAEGFPEIHEELSNRIEKAEEMLERLERRSMKKRMR
ncbi:bifunctional (p)ppGpp synthetase/guanosine-3',5'-bis(diphosphate) 3'-pyrophosphohydrolase [Candidatus Micrarchaeota archaeon]|nr:bifunctional (p)ppGpp synthetase/guanosine-3',5'-bis(diphosphate) 3'-pyrophosphohydrolase [Candidatus Micrarchaeota archaeon]